NFEKHNQGMEGLCVLFRAVSVNALIYVINAAAINAIKYFNAINATFFLCLYLDSYEVMTGRDAEKRWGEDWEITSGQTCTCVPSGNVSRGLGLPIAPPCSKWGMTEKV